MIWPLVILSITFIGLWAWAEFAVRYWRSRARSAEYAANEAFHRERRWQDKHADMSLQAWHWENVAKIARADKDAIQEELNEIAKIVPIGRFPGVTLSSKVRDLVRQWTQMRQGGTPL